MLKRFPVALSCWRMPAIIQLRQSALFVGPLLGQTILWMRGSDSATDATAIIVASSFG